MSCICYPHTMQIHLDHPAAPHQGLLFHACTHPQSRDGGVLGAREDTQNDLTGWAPFGGYQNWCHSRSHPLDPLEKHVYTSQPAGFVWYRYQHFGRTTSYVNAVTCFPHLHGRHQIRSQCAYVVLGFEYSCTSPTCNYEAIHV